jgi:hypothetical protein
MPSEIYYYVTSSYALFSNFPIFHRAIAVDRIILKLHVWMGAIFFNIFLF